MSIEKVNGDILYHICIYPEWDLEINRECNTGDFSRDYCKAKENKQKMETMFEVYRCEHTPTLPSRANVFYVCRENDVGLWIKKLTNGRCGYKIFKVELCGNLLWRDACYVDEVLPEDYWQDSSSVDDMTIPEGLFVGKYKALEIENYIPNN